MVVMASSSAASSGTFIFIRSLHKPIQKGDLYVRRNYFNCIYQTSKEWSPKFLDVGTGSKLDKKRKLNKKAVLRPVRV